MSDAVLDMLNAEAECIRAAVPIAGATATDAEVVARDEHARAALGSLLTSHGEPHQWYTCRLADGRIAGRWSDSWAEAVLYVAMWTGVAVERCVLDPGGELHSAERATDSAEPGLFDLLDLASEGDR